MVKSTLTLWAQYCMSVTPATWEAKTGRLQVQGPLGQFSMTLSQNLKRLVMYLTTPQVQSPATREKQGRGTDSRAWVQFPALLFFTVTSLKFRNLSGPPFPYLRDWIVNNIHSKCRLRRGPEFCS